MRSPVPQQVTNYRGFIHNVKLVGKMLRVKQWTKNLLLFAGLIFARQIFLLSKLGKASIAFIVFCLLSSALYIFNDLCDLENDRNHPRKRFRPIASGAITIRCAIAVLIVLTIISLGTAYWLGRSFFITALTYAALTTMYTVYFKKIVIIDVMILAAGFVIRAVAGALVINVVISPWLLVCTLLLALFLALIKRRQEIKKNGNQSGRVVLNEYTVPFLDQAITIITASTLTGYFLYTFTAHTQKLMLTIPFVLYGIFRYLLLVYKEDSGEEPEQVLISDFPFIINILLWLICSATILYMG